MTIGLVCPGSPVTQQLVNQTCQYLTARGYNYKLGNHLTESYLCDMSGTDEQRLEDLNSMIQSPDVHAIFTLRGGYGTHRLLDGIDYDALKSSPKWITGYSDITTLHLAIFQKANLISMHGPAVAYDFGESKPRPFMENAFWNMLEGQFNSTPLPLHEDNSWQSYTTLETWVSGKAQGRLIGGNLSRLAAMAGTDYALPKDEDLILFLEEVDEEAYRVDRFLTQLRESGAFNSVRAVLVGQHLAPDDKPETIPFIKRSLKDRLSDLGIPVIWGIPIGHHEYNMPIAHGSLVSINADTQQIHYMETPLS